MTSNDTSCPVSVKSQSSTCSSSSSSSPSPSSSLEASNSACPLGAHEGAGMPINPLTYMPFDSDLNAASNTSLALSRERESSTIPRADTLGESWKYPSPQMFYSALLRKGHPAPIENIDTMVAIHNTLNENVWQLVLQWEKSNACNACPEPKLKRFRGRPHDLSPKARFYSWFGITPPFDRHDWVVDRCGQEVRYVIDYYSGHPEPDGSPTMHVDVRPALDSIDAMKERSFQAWQEFRQWLSWN